MQTTILGRTNLAVSRLGIGGGGPSQLGRKTGRSESESIDLLCRDEPGVHVVLSGTGDPEHLAANLESFARPPLPTEMVQNLKRIFRNVDSTTGQ